MARSSKIFSSRSALFALAAALCLALLFFSLDTRPAQEAQPEEDARLWLSSEPWLTTDDSGKNSKRELTIGISVFASPNLNDPIIERTVAELREKLPNVSISVAQLWQQDLYEALKENRFDLILSSASFYFSARELGLKDLVTVVHDITPFPNESEGGVIAVRSERTDFNAIADLQGKTLAVNKPRGIFNYHVVMGEIASRGYDWKKFFSNEVISSSYEDVAQQLRSNKADAGFFKTCFLEQSGLAQTGEFKVIEPKNTNRIACKTSTDLYPNWTLSITPRAPQEIAGRITQLLLQMPPMADSGLRWDIATDFSGIDHLFRTLKVWHYDYLSDEWSLKRFFTLYRAYIAPGIIIVLMLILHGWILEKLVRRRTRELTISMQKQQASEEKAKAAGERLETLRRAGVTGQLSSIFVHEVRQPLASIICYIRGTQRLAEKEVIDRDRLKMSLDRIESEAERVDTIVERVRAYSKRTARKREVVDISAIARKVVEDFGTARRLPQKIQTNIEDGILIMADAFEMRVLIHNLIRNASEAMGEKASKPIKVRLVKDAAAGMCRLTVRDYGPKLSEDKLEGLQVALHSSKADGLGLGLAIIRSILEAHHGEIRFTPQDPQGLLARVLIPLKL